MNNIIFIAPPSSGKGTYSKMLKEKYGYIHISTGDLLRNISKTKSELGIQISKLLSQGNLIDDELIFKIIKEELTNLDATKPFILDGVPRNLNQVIYLENVLNDLNINNYKVIYLETDYQSSLKKALGRMSCLNCGSTYNEYFEKFKPKIENICDKCNHKLMKRTDDNEQSFKKRFNDFNKNIIPILNYYEKKNKLNKIEIAQFTNEQIFDIIINMVKET